MRTDDKGQRLGAMLLLGAGLLVAFGWAKPLKADASGLADGLLGSVPIVQPATDPSDAQQASPSPGSPQIPSTSSEFSQLTPTFYGLSPMAKSPSFSTKTMDAADSLNGISNDQREPLPSAPLTSVVEKTIEEVKAVGDKASGLTDPVTTAPLLAQPVSRARPLTDVVKSVDSAAKPILDEVGQTLEPVAGPLAGAVPSVSRTLLGQAVPSLPDPLLQQPSGLGTAPSNRPEPPELSVALPSKTTMGVGVEPTAAEKPTPAKADRAALASMTQGGASGDPLAPKPNSPPLGMPNGMFSTPASASSRTPGGGGNAQPDWHGGYASAVLPDDPLQRGMEGTRLPVRAIFLADQWVHAPPGPPPRALLLF